MTKYKSVPIKRIVDVVILVMRWKGDIIYNISRNPVFNMTPVIEFRGPFFPLPMTSLFPGPVFSVDSIVQLDQLGKADLRQRKLGQKLGSKRS